MKPLEALGLEMQQSVSSAPTSEAGSPLAAVMIKPRQLEQIPPCAAGCASGADVRAWIGLVAQRRKLGLSKEEAYRQAWIQVAAVNPFPASLGRICPHPCEDGCSRKDKDGAIAINALERFLGDWALKQRLSLPRLQDDTQPESIGVIGAGPAGLSFAYQMARRGYRVTVYEKQDKPGGMLYYGIPEYRLPEDVLLAEVSRILDLGVELRLKTPVGKECSFETLQSRHKIIFLGIGAGRGLKLGIAGEDGPGVWTGTDYLSRLNRGEPVDIGFDAIVVGGGNTAIDAARAARRAGARVTMLYRRTRNEMPAIDSEIEDALAEGVRIEYLVAPVELRRDGDKVCAVVVQRMELGEPDSSGRRKPLPRPGSEYEIPADAVIAAVSQEPDWDGLNALDPGTVWVRTDARGRFGAGLWAGGDALGLGIAALAIAQGRQAAEAVHAQLRGLEKPGTPERPALPAKTIKADLYLKRKRLALPAKPVEERLAQPDAEVQQTITEEQFLREASRCFSCGLCYGCEYCFMYCNAGGFSRLAQVKPGAYFTLSLECCESCGQCIELCPCGYLTRP